MVQNTTQPFFKKRDLHLLTWNNFKETETKKWQRQKATCCICTKRGVNMCVYMYINMFIYIYMLGRQFQFLEKYKMKYLWIAIGCLWWGELFSTYPFILIVFIFKSSICRKIFQCNSYKNPSWLICRNWQVDSKIYMEQEATNNQNNPEKEQCRIYMSQFQNLPQSNNN